MGYRASTPKFFGLPCECPHHLNSTTATKLGTVTHPGKKHVLRWTAPPSRKIHDGGATDPHFSDLILTPTQYDRADKFCRMTTLGEGNF